MSDPIRSSGWAPLGKRAKKRRASAARNAEYERRRVWREQDETAAKEAAGQTPASGPMFGTRSGGYRAKASLRKVWPRIQ